MPTLYVTEPGARIEKEYQSIIVTRDDEVLLSVPLRLVSEVVLIGYAGATTQAMLSLLDQGCGLSLVTRTGKLRGRLQAVDAPNLALRKLQYASVQDQDLKLIMIRSIVKSKLENSRVMALRILRSIRKRDTHLSMALADQLARIDRSITGLSLTTDEDALRGLEGIAAKAYFAIFRSGLAWQGDHPFEKRTRRPPKDPVNVLLSLGYTLCTDALFTACEVVGLDPYCGFYHADRYGRPALALDLVEEFRSIIVDSVVLLLVNKRMIKPADFSYDPSDPEHVNLNSRGMKTFLVEFTRRLNTHIYHPLAGRSISYQKCFELQARQVRKIIEGSQEKWIPMKVR